MATSTLEKVPGHNVDDDLTDEQMDELLARASARLKEQSKLKDLMKLDEKEAYTFPKLQTGKLEQPYVSNQGDVATVDAKRLVEGKDRKQSNGIRRVEEPVAAKKLAIEVCRRTTNIHIRAMRKIVPNLLEQSPGAVLVCLSV